VKEFSCGLRNRAMFGNMKPRKSKISNLCFLPLRKYRISKAKHTDNKRLINLVCLGFSQYLKIVRILLKANMMMHMARRIKFFM
jgi:hypothetical protein